MAVMALHMHTSTSYNTKPVIHTVRKGETKKMCKMSKKVYTYISLYIAFFHYLIVSYLCFYIYIHDIVFLCYFALFLLLDVIFFLHSVKGLQMKIKTINLQVNK